MDYMLLSGKYKGNRLSQIPSDYLLWVAENWKDDHIAGAADKEYNRRTLDDDHFLINEFGGIDEY